MVIIYDYPTCTTCKRAKKFLSDNGIEFKAIDLKEETPSKETLLKVLGYMGVKRLFNTSGKTYRDTNLKSKLKDLTTQEAIDLLSSDGSLIKRPILIDEEKDLYLLGFNETDWKQLISK